MHICRSSHTLICIIPGEVIIYGLNNCKINNALETQNPRTEGEGRYKVTPLVEELLLFASF